MNDRRGNILFTHVKNWHRIACCFAVLLASACEHAPTLPPEQNSAKPPVTAAPIPQPLTNMLPLSEKMPEESRLEPARQVYTPDSGSATPMPSSKAELLRGDGVFLKPRDSGPRRQAAAGDITLNFEDTDLQEVVKVILADILGVNYVIDPTVTGTVTIQSSQPFSKDSLLPVLETLLQMNDAALVYREGTYRIVPLANASREAVPPKVGAAPLAGERGFRTHVVPLRYVSVSELQKLLEPFMTDVLLRADQNRNVLILAGTERDLDRILETIAIFDVDWLKGMSVGLIPLDYADAKSIVEELENVFGKKDESPLSGLVRFVAVERLNSVLVMSQQPDYLDQAHQWIRRLDRAEGKPGQQLFVYFVQNGKAADLAAVLSNIFGGSTAERAPAELAPGLEPVSLSSPAAAEGDAPASTPGPPRAAPASTASDIELPSGSNIRIIADEVNNALVILATADDYRMVETTLRKLDITPLQVLIEASIIEVSLTDDLEFGVEWFFRNISGETRGTGLLDFSPADTTLGPIIPGFSYTITGVGDVVRGVINTLASQSKIKVLSSPSLMVLDNQTATINVGDQVPIPTRSSVSNIDPDAPTVNEIEYRDTGVLLEVTPRVNASGFITMEIRQEVTDVAQTTSSGIDAPTFLQRSINSTVGVASGNTIVLGGLIDENNSQSKSGVPGLHRAPIIGHLFGRTDRSTSRTELLVLITPRAVRNEYESRDATEELKRKLKGLAPSLREQHKL